MGGAGRVEVGEDEVQFRLGGKGFWGLEMNPLVRWDKGVAGGGGGGLTMIVGRLGVGGVTVWC